MQNTNKSCGFQWGVILTLLTVSLAMNYAQYTGKIYPKNVAIQVVATNTIEDAYRNVDMTNPDAIIAAADAYDAKFMPPRKKGK